MRVLLCSNCYLLNKFVNQWLSETVYKDSFNCYPAQHLNILKVNMSYKE